jgi:hypothetical protein
MGASRIGWRCRRLLLKEKGQRDAALKLVAPEDFSLGEKYRSLKPSG